jgi:hypothetical protein
MNGLMPQTERRSFNSILLSEPVMLTRFGGDYAGVGVIYNQGKVLSWHLHDDDVLGELNRRMRKFRRDSTTSDRRFAEAWGKKDAAGEPLKDENNRYVYDDTRPGFDDAFDV